MPQNDNKTVQMGFYNVPERPIIRKNLDMYSKAMDNLYEQHREALKQRSAIDVALSQIELDASEDNWKYNYAKQIRDSIDAQAQYGDYSKALDAATMAASTAISSPELIGRQRAHKDREEEWQKVQQRNDIDEDTKRAWELTNQYYYKDTRDDKGNIIGGTKWKSNWTPVSNVNIVGELAKAISLIAPEQGQTSTTTGGTTTTETGTSSGGQTSESSSYNRLTLDRINKQLKEYIENNPQLKASILQEYKVNKILLQDAENRLANATTEEEINDINSEIALRKSNLTNHNGIVTGDYMTLVYQKYGNALIPNFAYNNITSSYTNIQNTDNYNRQKAGQSFGATYDPITGKLTSLQGTGVTAVETIQQGVGKTVDEIGKTTNELNNMLDIIAPWQN